MRLATLSTFLSFCLVIPICWASCKCTAPTLASSFQASTVVVKAQVTSNRAAGAGGKREYNARVLTIYKGCNVTENQSVVLTTNTSADTCGALLNVATTYLLMGKVDRVVKVPSTSGPQNIVYISISKCQFQARFNILSSYQLQLLKQLQAKVPPCNKKCSSTTCNSSSQFCSTSDGSCRSFGKCASIDDCLNPNNKYFTILCVGYLTCVNGGCGRTCGPSSCPPSAPQQTKCPTSPCVNKTKACPSSSTYCIDYNCGKCKSLCF